MRATERITVTVPKRVADQIRATVQTAEAQTVSGYVAEVLVERFREENVERLLADLAAAAEPMTDAARQWARETVVLARGAR